MNILLWSFFLFVLSFITHLIVWKIKIPKRQTKTILQIFFGVWIIAVLFTRFNPDFPLFSFSAPAKFLDLLHMALFHTSLTLAYMITYSAMEADSPTLVMILKIASAGTEGLEKSELDKSLTDHILVIPRIQDLLRDKLALIRNGKYQLTPKGTLFARIFICYRNLLKAQQGG